MPSIDKDFQSRAQTAQTGRATPSLPAEVPADPAGTLSSPTEPQADVGDRRRLADGDYEYLLRQRGPEVEGGLDELQQPWLFPQSDLTVPEGALRMRKAVAAIHAVPVGADVTLNTRRLFDALVMVAQMDIRGRGPDMMERIKRERVSPFFEVRITELARLAGIKGKNYKRIYEDLDEIFDMKLEWNVVGEDSTVEWQMKAHFLATYGRGKGPLSGLIRFSVDPSILQIVLDPANWATLSLKVLRGMPTAASYQLYQNAWRYINTAQKVTAPLPVETWIELILGPSRYVKIDPRSKKKTASEYGDFKRRYLLDALERVNATAALDHAIELKEIRSGKRVAKLQFKFHRKAQQRLELPMAWDQALIDQLRVLGFSSQDIAELSQVHSADRMQEALLRLVDAKQRKAVKGEVIVTPRAFLEGILSRMVGEPGQAALVEQHHQEQQGTDHERLLEQQRHEQEQAQRLAEEFELHCRERFRLALAAAQPELVERCRDAFRASAQYASSKFIIERSGWDSPVITNVLGSWLRKHESALYEQLLPLPQDQDLAAWLEGRGQRQQS